VKIREPSEVPVHGGNFSYPYPPEYPHPFISDPLFSHIRPQAYGYAADISADLVFISVKDADKNIKSGLWISGYPLTLVQNSARSCCCGPGQGQAAGDGAPLAPVPDAPAAASRQPPGGARHAGALARLHHHPGGDQRRVSRGWKNAKKLENLNFGKKISKFFSKF
jgi:hypothetical protein